MLGITTVLDFLAIPLLLQYSVLLASCVTKTHYCLLFSFLSTGRSRVFFCITAFYAVMGQLYGWVALFCPICRTLHLPLLKLMNSLSARFISPLRSFRISSLLASILTTPHNLVLYTNLQCVPPVLLSELLTKMLNFLCMSSMLNWSFNLPLL